jgi:hypothetical protein
MASERHELSFSSMREAWPELLSSSDPIMAWIVAASETLCE